MQTFIECIAVARKFQLQNEEIIQSNGTDEFSSGCVFEERCITLQLISDNLGSIVKRMSDQVLIIIR